MFQSIAAQIKSSSILPMITFASMEIVPSMFISPATSSEPTKSKFKL